jgi:hypothetical protein
MDSKIDHGLSTEDFQTFLEAGRWSATADDNVAGEKVTADAVRRIVQAYNDNPEGRMARRGLGLLALMLGVAEWGVDGHDGLPEDPNSKNWSSNAGPTTGKHLMSYAIGGVGISHADVGDLQEFVNWIAGSSGVVPDARKEALLRLTEVKYQHADRGIQYDEVRAAGLCKQQPKGQADKDLLGELFHYTSPGPVDCDKWRNDKLNPLDWLTFRTWIRVALRTQDAQAYLLRLWFEKYWDKTLSMLPPGESFAEEAVINVRIRNSLPKAADAAIKLAAAHHGTAEKIQVQLKEYDNAKPGTPEHPGPAKRRWKIMMRPVVLYRHVLGKDPLVGVNLHNH